MMAYLAAKHPSARGFFTQLLFEHPPDNPTPSDFLESSSIKDGLGGVSKAHGDNLLSTYPGGNTKFDGYGD
eukprot:6187245-Pleurochrysis_carterae.AAC.3